MSTEQQFFNNFLKNVWVGGPQISVEKSLNDLLHDPESLANFLGHARLHYLIDGTQSPLTLLCRSQDIKLVIIGMVITARRWRVW